MLIWNIETLSCKSFQVHILAIIWGNKARSHYRRKVFVVLYSFTLDIMCRNLNREWKSKLFTFVHTMKQWIITNTEEIIHGVGSDISYLYTRRCSVLSFFSLCSAWCLSFTIFIKTTNLLGSQWRTVSSFRRGFIRIFTILVMLPNNEWVFIWFPCGGSMDVWSWVI